jgi:hypothetical protein
MTGRAVHAQLRDPSSSNGQEAGDVARPAPRQPDWRRRRAIWSPTCAYGL